MICVCSPQLLGTIEQAVPQAATQVQIATVWRVQEVQQQVVVLDQTWPQDMAKMQGEGRGLLVLVEAQVQDAQQAGQRLQVVVVDEAGPKYVEAVQGEGEELDLLDGQQLRCRTVLDTSAALLARAGPSLPARFLSRFACMQNSKARDVWSR